MALRLRQGVAADRTSITPASGELIYTTDTKLVYVGDGTTAGGNLLSGGGGGGVTYTISSETTTGGANLRLTGSDASTDNVKFAAGANITVTRTDANTITIAGTGSGSFNSFRVSGDDSNTITINDNDVLSVLGNNLTNVYFDEFSNLTIDTPNPIRLGISNTLSYYATTNRELFPAAGLIYDIATGELTSPHIKTNRLEANVGNFAIFPDVSTETISFGGTLNGVDLSCRFVQNDFGPVDPAAPFSVDFRNVHNDAFVNSMLLSRARGTNSSLAAVQTNDFIHAVIFTAHDGSNFAGAAQIAAQCVGPPVPTKSIPTALYFTTGNGVDASPQIAIALGEDQYTNLFGVLKFGTQTVNTTGGDVTLTKSQVRGSVIFSEPLGSTRRITLPAPNAAQAGVRLLFYNISSSQSLQIAFTGSGGPFKTLIAGTLGEVLCTGSTWVSVF